jgi:hypothetical protein
MRQFLLKVLLMSGTAALVGCGVPGVPKPPSLDLPEPVTDLRAVRKGDSVFLDWTIPSETTDHLPVRDLGPTLVCRSLDAAITTSTNSVAKVPAPPPAARNHRMTKSAKRSANIPASYVDNLPSTILVKNPAARIFYALSVLNENGRTSGISNVVQVPALPALPPPSEFRAQVTAEGVVLTWTATAQAPAIPGVEYLYRVYRRPDGGNVDTVVGELPLLPSVATQMLDRSFEWEKTYFYRATVVTRIHEAGKAESQFEGTDTPAEKVFTHDVFPPAVPSGLQAVFSGAGREPFIDLIWGPNVEADLAGYNIYRRESTGEPVKLNSEPVKTPAFRDMKVNPGKTYFYSVSAVDVRGNESARSQETSEAVP